MRFRTFDFGFSILVGLGLGSADEAIFSHIFPNAMKTTTIEQPSLRQDLTSKLFDTKFDLFHDIELDDLENIMNIELAQGLQSDTEFSYF